MALTYLLCHFLLFSDAFLRMSAQSRKTVGLLNHFSAFAAFCYPTCRQETSSAVAGKPHDAFVQMQHGVADLIKHARPRVCYHA